MSQSFQSSSNGAAASKLSSETKERGDNSQDFVNFSVLCMHDFNTEDIGRLSFQKNEILDVIQRDESGWWAAIRHTGPTGPSVGWIPQAYVSILSEEMATRLRSKHEFSAKWDCSAAAGHSGEVDGRLSPVTVSEHDFQQYAFPSRYGSTDRLVQGSWDKNVYRHSSDSGGTSTTSSSILLPPSRSTSFKKGWKPKTVLPDGTRQRAGSLTPSRSRRHPIPDLSVRSSNVEATKPRELTKMPSSTFTGNVDWTRWRKASEDSSIQHHTSTPFRRLPKYKLDQDDKGHVRSGTLPALVERLTLEIPTNLTKRSESRAFSDAFLMTFRTFTTPDVLFDMLLEHYYASPSDAEWIHYRLRVLNIFTSWLEEHRLLDEEPDIAGRLTDFLTGLNDVLLAKHIQHLLHSIQRLTSTPADKVATTVSSKKARKSKAHKNELSKMDPVDIAEQLTLLELSLYVQITPQECLAYAKMQSGATVSKLLEFCATHDKLAAWVKHSVLSHEAMSKRAELIDFWIKVAEKCRHFNNFSSMAAIITALSSTVLTQLTVTYVHVNRNSTLDSLLRYNEPTGGFAGYRSLLQQAEGSCVPFIAMYLTDIVHTGQLSQDETDVILFFQRARWHGIITQMLKFQSRPYKIAPSEATTRFIEGRIGEAPMDDNWFWQRSQELQQAEAAHADIRKGFEAAGF